MIAYSSVLSILFSLQLFLPTGKQTHPTEKNTPRLLRNEVPFQETIARKKSSKATEEKVGSYSTKTTPLTWSMQNFKEP